MIRFLYRCLLPTLLLAGFPFSVRADNPKVSLKLTDAPFNEAVQALSRASGIHLELARRPQLPEEAPDPLPPGLEARSTFNWTNVPFARALRELCTRYGLTPFRDGTGYTLHAIVPPPRPQHRYGLVQKGSARFYISDLNSRRIPASNGRPEQVLLFVTLDCEWPDGDAGAITHFMNVRACDDLGNIIKPDRSHGFPQRFYPDERAIALTFHDPDPRAHRLQWLEGEIMAQQQRRRVRLESPVGPRAMHTAHDGAEVEVQPLGPVHRDEKRGSREEVQTLAARLTVNEAHGLRVNLDTIPAPDLVGVSGTTYRAAVTGGQTYNRAAGRFTCDLKADYTPLPERIVRAVFSWIEEAPETLLYTVRLTDLPLPPVEAFPPRPAAPPAAPSNGNAGAHHVFYQQGGGTLKVPAQVDGKPVSGGIFSLGLSLKEGEVWSAVRWIDVPVRPDGTARLPDLRPGLYRVERSYRRDAAAPAGRPMGMPVEVQVEAGKVVGLP